MIKKIVLICILVTSLMGCSNSGKSSETKRAFSNPDAPIAAITRDGLDDTKNNNRNSISTILGNVILLPIYFDDKNDDEEKLLVYVNNILEQSFDIPESHIENNLTYYQLTVDVKKNITIEFAIRDKIGNTSNFVYYQIEVL